MAMKPEKIGTKKWTFRDVVDLIVLIVSGLFGFLCLAVSLIIGVPLFVLSWLKNLLFSLVGLYFLSLFTGWLIFAILDKPVVYEATLFIKGFHTDLSVNIMFWLAVFVSFMATWSSFTEDMD